eukprot:5747508-Pyramimonas_sp.AAC.1
MTRIHFAPAALRGVRARSWTRSSDVVQCDPALARFLDLASGICYSLPSLCDRIQTLQSPRILEFERAADGEAEPDVKARARP